MTTTKRLYLQDKKDSMDILVKDGSVKWVSARLLQMSGFEGEELLGKSIEKVWHSILRIAVPYPDLKGVLHIEGCFFFSKTYEVYFSKLRLEQNADENGSTSITFIKSFRFFEKKFPTAQVMLGEKNLAVAVFANENHILLGANSGFLDLMEEPRNQLENAAGVRAEEVFGGPNCNMGISMLTTVSKTMRPCILKDLKWSNKCRDTMFINVIIIPVLDEKKVSLLLFMMEDVTIKMLSSNQIARQVKIIQQQKENLETTIENMSDGFCIADPQGNILYMNGQMRSYLNVQGNIRSLRDLMEINTFTTKEGNRIEKLELGIQHIPRDPP